MTNDSNLPNYQINIHQSFLHILTSIPRTISYGVQQLSDLGRLLRRQENLQTCSLRSLKKQTVRGHRPTKATITHLVAPIPETTMFAIRIKRDPSNEWYGRGVNLAIISIVMTSVAACLVAMRLVSRFDLRRVKGKGLGPDDFAIVGSWVRPSMSVQIVVRQVSSNACNSSSPWVSPSRIVSVRGYSDTITSMLHPDTDQ